MTMSRSLKRASEDSTSPYKKTMSGRTHYSVNNSTRHATIDQLRTEYTQRVHYDNDQLLAEKFKTTAVTKRMLKAVKSKNVQAVLQGYLDDYLRQTEEKDRYQPMVDYITTVVDETRHANKLPFHRQTVKTGYTTTKSNFTLINLRRPDLTTFDDTAKTRHDNFQYAAALWELKVKAKDAPGPDAHKAIIGQVADVVRLRMASRPFQLYTLSLMLCDSYFCVAMWDRDGCVVSKSHHIKKDQDMFLRVVISLHCCLDLYDLGLDRNVTIPKDYHYIPLNPCPTLSFGGYKWDLVKTIFQSITAIGRGTSVWHVRRCADDGQVFEHAIKWSWRSPNRPTEAEIHRKIQAAFDGQQPPEIALLDYVEDEHEASPEEPADVVNITSLRKNLQNCEPVQDMILTCILLKRVGKPIWDYEDDVEILRGGLDILEGLVALGKIRWMHRDVSSGNCLLRRDGDPGPSFISDLEFAKEMGQPSSGHAISGTAQFMAYDILLALSDNSPHSHQLHHDLEAFVYVLVYAIMTKEFHALEREKAQSEKAVSKARAAVQYNRDADEETQDVGDSSDAAMDAKTPLQTVKLLLAQLFGHTSYSEIAAQRDSMSSVWMRFIQATKPPLPSRDPDEYRSPLDFLIRRLLGMVFKQNAKPKAMLSSDDEYEDEPNPAKRAKKTPLERVLLDGPKMLTIIAKLLAKAEAAAAKEKVMAARSTTGDKANEADETGEKEGGQEEEGQELKGAGEGEMEDEN